VPSASRTSGSRPAALVDTSVAVALVLVGHQHHPATLEALAGRKLGLSGHAAFETYSVLTRLPSPARRTPAAVGRLLSVNFPETRFLSPAGAAELLASLPKRGLAGGSVYDALVGAAAAEHGRVRVTRDRRALDVYRALGVDAELLG